MTDTIMALTHEWHRNREEWERVTSANLDAWCPACGGDEVHFTYYGTRWLRVWNPKREEHGYLNLDTDVVYTDYKDGEVIA